MDNESRVMGGFISVLMLMGDSVDRVMGERWLVLAAFDCVQLRSTAFDCVRLRSAPSII